MKSHGPHRAATVLAAALWTAALAPPALAAFDHEITSLGSFTASPGDPAACLGGPGVTPEDAPAAAWAGDAHSLFACGAGPCGLSTLSGVTAGAPGGSGRPGGLAAPSCDSQPPAVPELPTYILMGGGLLALLWLRRRSRH